MIKFFEQLLIKVINFYLSLKPNTWELEIDPSIFKRHDSGGNIEDKLFEAIIEEKSLRSEIKKRDWVVIHLYPKQFKELEHYHTLFEKKSISDMLFPQPDKFKWPKHKVIIKLLPQNADYRKVTGND